MDCLDELKKEYPDAATKAVICDFGKFGTIAEYRELCQREIEGMNIGVVFLNANHSSPMCPFHLKTDNEVEIIIRVNVLHVVYLSKILLEKLVKRK